MTAYWNRCRRHYGKLGMALLLFYAITSMVQNLITIACLRHAPGLLRQSWFTLALSVLPMYLLGFPAFLLMLPPAPPPSLLPRREKLKVGQVWTLLLCCFGVLIPGNLLGRGLDWMVCRLAGVASRDRLAVLVTDTPFWLLTLVLVGIAPVMEELCFRKLLLDRMRTIDKPSAALFSALSFGLMHGNLQQFFYAFSVGAILACVYLRTGRLRVCVLLHMLVNLFGSVVVLLLYGQVNLTEPLSSLLPLLGLGVYSVCMYAAAIAGIVLLCRHRQSLEPADGHDLLREHRWLPFLTPGYVAFVLGVLFVGAISYLPR